MHSILYCWDNKESLTNYVCRYHLYLFIHITSWALATATANPPYANNKSVKAPFTFAMYRKIQYLGETSYQIQHSASPQVVFVITQPQPSFCIICTSPVTLLYHILTELLHVYMAVI